MSLFKNIGVGTEEYRSKKIDEWLDSLPDFNRMEYGREGNRVFVPYCRCYDYFLEDDIPDFLTFTDRVVHFRGRDTAYLWGNIMFSKTLFDARKIFHQHFPILEKAWGVVVGVFGEEISLEFTRNDTGEWECTMRRVLKNSVCECTMGQDGDIKFKKSK